MKKLYLVITIVTILAINGLGQNTPQAQQTPAPKKSKSFDMNDLPGKSATTSEDTLDSYNKRKNILTYKATTPEDQQIELVNIFLDRQSKDNPTDFCFCNIDLSTKLFAVRSWTIVEKLLSPNVGIFTLRIDSSNKGGQPVTNLWTMYTTKSKYGDYCVAIFKKTQE